MKKYKYLSLIIVLIILLSAFSISVNAEEVDYSKVIAVGSDGVYTYYSISAVGSDVEWKAFIDYYDSSIGDDFPFWYIGDYVLYKGQFLTDSRTLSYVTVSDSVYCSSNRYYSPYSFISVSDESLIWNFPNYDYSIGTIVSAIIESDPDSLFSIGGYNGYYKVYYNSIALCNYDIFVETGHTFSLSGDPCSHDYVQSEIITEATCIEEGLAVFTCRACGASEERSISAEEGYGHNWISIDIDLHPTCTSSGYYTDYCELCGTTEKVYAAALGHSFSNPTCTESGKCIRCDAEGDASTGHVFKWWSVKCQICGYNKAASWFESKSKNVIDGLENSFTLVKTAAESLLQNTIGWISDVKDEADNTVTDIQESLDKLLSILSLIAFIFGAVFLIKLFKKLNLKKGTLLMSRNYYRRNTKNKTSIVTVIASVLAIIAIAGFIGNLFDVDLFKKSEETYTTVYLVPGDAWLEDGSSVGAYVWNDLSTKFILGADSDEDGVYEFEISTKYDGVVFVDLKPDTTSLGLSWCNVRAQSDDLELPSDKNVYYHQYASEWSASADKLFEVTKSDTSVFLDCANWSCTVKPVVYYFDKTGVSESGFISMTQCGASQYLASIPAGYTHVIFIEYSSEDSVGSWDYILNQTADLIIPAGTATHFNTETNVWDVPSAE